MPIAPGSRLGAYEVLTPLGAGGMGEVFRARDTKLRREVALKILPGTFAADPERRARFTREAHVLASLNHPNIAAIYGIEEADGLTALVLELVEGPTLADQIARGPLPIDEALKIAAQIADGLDAAHERGIVHRDLKPANIKVTDDGRVKVLDFGLAKALTDDTSPDASMSPTMTAMASRLGVIVGTAAYMSPEQAKGKTVDSRTDIWAFACVLYEMLAGRAAFQGETVAENIAAVIEREPTWDALPGTTPPAIRRLLGRCFEKDPKRRLRSIADAALDIDDALADREEIESPTRGIRHARRPLLTAGLVLAAFATGALSSWISRVLSTRDSGATSVVDRHEIRFEVQTPPTSEPASIALSPDATKLVFVASSEGRSQLWLRPIDSVSARPLAGTDNAAQPFWSPDGSSIGFFADGQLKRINIQDGVVQVLANAPASRGATWARDATILFQRSPGSLPLLRLMSTGGDPVPMETTRPGARFPQWLPDGRHFLYRAAAGVFVGTLNENNTQHLFDADSAAVFAPPGDLLFIRQGTLFAVAFDADRLQVTGNPTAVAGDMSVSQPLGLASISTSSRGAIAYRTGSAGGLRQFVWVDRSGNLIGRVGDPVSGMLAPEMSPDGRFVAVHRAVVGNSDIWILDVQRGVISRFTSSSGQEYYPVWSPDGRTVFFNSGGDIHEKSRDATSAEQLVKKLERAASPTDLSRDGEYLLCLLAEPAPHSDLWAVPMKSEEKPFAVAATPADERDGKFAPNGKWIAYQSDESGRYEIYVQRFPGPGGRVQISKNGGAMVRWRSDGKELFYIALDGRLMAVPIRMSADGSSLDAGAPEPLFPTRVGGALQGNSWAQYIPSLDGRRFLMNTLVEEAAAPITVVLNWRPKS
jgi:eukaryotic-like serine/threonine-protein kinase